MRTGLVRERITDSRGKRRTVWRRPRGNRDIPRKDMVQMDPSEHAGFIKFLKSRGVGVEKKERKVKDLKTTQRDMDQKKIDRIAKDIRENGFKRVKRGSYLVDKDGHIMDGHHRWGGAMQVDEDATLTVREINAPISFILAEAKEYKDGKKG